MTPDAQRSSAITSAVLWGLWITGCVIVPIACWFYAFVSTMAFFNAAVAPESITTAHGPRPALRRCGVRRS